MEEAHTAVAEAERALQSATERLARAAHQAVDKLSGYGEDAEYKLRGTAQAANERSRELFYQVRGYIEEHPVAAIGIALAVGFTFGVLMRAGDASASTAEETP